MPTLARRHEARIPLSIGVDLSSLDIRHPPQGALTENISLHGVRVVASKPWKLNDRLNVRSSPGDFRARARVVYCEPHGADAFAIGLHLIAAAGNWK
jgi:hypothetical protein